MKSIVNIVLILLTTTLVVTPLYAQKYPERKYIRSGNSKYENQNYVEAEIAYRRALSADSTSRDAVFNLGAAYYKQERYQEAAGCFGQLTTDSTLTTEFRSQVLYNTGNTLFKERQLEQALDAYKNALRLNPNDLQAKFNYAYTKKLLQNKNDKNKDKNQDKDDKDQNNENNKDDKDKKDNSDNKDNKDKPQPKPGDGQQQGGMSREEADRMLEAMQVNEDKTRDKLKNDKKVVAAPPSGKNW